MRVRQSGSSVRRLVAAAIAVVAVGGGSSAAAQPYLPAPGTVFQGVTDEPVSAYVAAVGKHPAIYQEFVAWGQYLPGLFSHALAAGSRPMIEITTAYGSREAITPAGIAAGRGDAWLIGLNHDIALAAEPVYVRLMGEMDGYWNPYSAYNSNGTPRDASHSTAAFKRAFERVALILRGGSLAGIDAELARLGMPRLNASSDLPRTAVAMIWAPQVAGSPDVPGNQPRAYWPGRRWVDWVGTDFYSKFPNFSGLDSFYRAFGGEPFAFGEYAIWGVDDPGFVHQLFGWVAAHRRVRMLVYNQGAESDGPFRLSRYPRAARALRSALAPSRFPVYPPAWRP